LVVEVLPLFLNQPGAQPLEEAWLEAPRLPAAEVAACWTYHSRPTDLARQWSRSRLFAAGGLQPEVQAYCGLGLPGTRRTDGGLGVLDDFGWHAHHLPPLAEAERRRHFDFARQQYRAALGEFRLGVGPSRALRDLLRRGREERLPMLLLTMPESRPFRDLYSPTLRQGLSDFLQDLAKEEAVPLIAADTWADDGDFWDGHHLLPAGAARFSARFEEAVLRPRLKKMSRR
jgi:hypothetical protein